MSLKFALGLACLIVLYLPLGNAEYSNFSFLKKDNYTKTSDTNIYIIIILDKKNYSN